MEARVHFHEPDAIALEALAGVGDELHRAGADIIHGFRRQHRRVGDSFACFVAHARRGRFFDHLLVAALQRTIALEQMHDIAVRIAEHLHLDVERALHVHFQQHAIVAER